MKNKITKPLLFILCAALLIGGIGATVNALNSDKTDKTETETPLHETEAQADITKDETVYVLAGADGSVQTVSYTHLLPALILKRVKRCGT